MPYGALNAAAVPIPSAVVLPSVTPSDRGNVALPRFAFDTYIEGTQDNA